MPAFITSLLNYDWKMILHSCAFTLDGFFDVLVTFLAWNIEVSHNPLQKIRFPQVPTNRSFNVNCKTDLMTSFTLNTSIVIAVLAGNIVPSVAIIGTQSVNTVFVFPVVWLLRSPEPKTGYFLVCPDKWSLNASVIKSNPWSLSIMTVLNVDIFFLVVHCYQMWVHGLTNGHSSHPRSAYRAC